MDIAGWPVTFSMYQHHLDFVALLIIGWICGFVGSERGGEGEGWETEEWEEKEEKGEEIEERRKALLPSLILKVDTYANELL